MNVFLINLVFVNDLIDSKTENPIIVNKRTDALATCFTCKRLTADICTYCTNCKSWMHTICGIQEANKRFKCKICGFEDPFKSKKKRK